MKPPFKTPVRLEGTLLVGADCKEIAELDYAWPRERAEIVKRINLYDDLVRDLGQVLASARPLVQVPGGLVPVYVPEIVIAAALATLQAAREDA